MSEAGKIAEKNDEKYVGFLPNGSPVVGHLSDDGKVLKNCIGIAFQPGGEDSSIGIGAQTVFHPYTLMKKLQLDNIPAIMNYVQVDIAVDKFIMLINCKELKLGGDLLNVYSDTMSKVVTKEEIELDLMAKKAKADQTKKMTMKENLKPPTGNVIAGAFGEDKKEDIIV